MSFAPNVIGNPAGTSFWIVFLRGGGCHSVDLRIDTRLCCMNSDNNSDPANGSDRRDFVKACCAVAVGGVAVSIPLAAGLNFASDPIRRGPAQAGGFLKVAHMGALPEDGAPRKFAVVADKSDVWNKFPNVPIGSVYLRRLAANKVEALSVICPHAGCAVDYQPEKGNFLCPCHNSAFGLDGSISDRRSPSARPLDTLEVELREGGEIWVRYQNFRAGIAEKLPLT